MRSSENIGGILAAYNISESRHFRLDLFNFSHIILKSVQSVQSLLQNSYNASQSKLTLLLNFKEFTWIESINFKFQAVKFFKFALFWQGGTHISIICQTKIWIFLPLSFKNGSVWSLVRENANQHKSVPIDRGNIQTQWKTATSARTSILQCIKAFHNLGNALDQPVEDSPNFGADGRSSHFLFLPAPNHVSADSSCRSRNCLLLQREHLDSTTSYRYV